MNFLLANAGKTAKVQKRHERHKSSVGVQPYRCLFTARLLREGHIPAAIAAADQGPRPIMQPAWPCFVYFCAVWSNPKSEVVFGSTEVKP